MFINWTFRLCFGSYCLKRCMKSLSLFILVQVIALQVPVGKLCRLSQTPDYLAQSNCNILHLYRIFGIFSACTILKEVHIAKAAHNQDS